MVERTIVGGWHRKHMHKSMWPQETGRDTGNEQTVKTIVDTMWKNFNY